MAMSGSNWAASTAFSYDGMGRVAGLGECLPFQCGNTQYDKYLSYQYDLAGNLKTANDGTSTTTTYAYSPASEVTSITSSMSGTTYPSSLVYNVQNGPFGPVNYSYGNGLTQVNAYDSLGRIGGGWVCTGGVSCPSNAYGFTSGWKGMRLTTSSDNIMGQNTTYGYDEFNRLTSSTYSTQGFSYDYDRYGNRWNKTVTAGSGTSVNLQFNTATNQVNGVTYDAAGNVTNDGYHSYTYDAEGNITQVDGGTTAKYYYNALNQRVRADAGSTSREYVFNPSGQRVSVWDGNTQAQVQGQYYWGSTPVAFYSGGSLHFQHQDWMGTERIRTTYNGGTEGSYASLPFGDGYSASGSDNDPYHFAQLDQDVPIASGSFTEHAQFRNYSSTQGRWLSPDPYSGSYDPTNPQSFNRYVYAGNNPLGATDPRGLMAVLLAITDSNGGTVYVSVDSEDLQQAGFNVQYNSDHSGVVSITAPTDGAINFVDSSGNQLGTIASGTGVTFADYSVNQSVTVTPSGNDTIMTVNQTTYSFIPGSSAPSQPQVPVKQFPWHYGNWCGSGGSGTPIDDTDNACKFHDQCFDFLNISADDYTSGRLTPSQLQGAAACNQQLCNAASNANLSPFIPFSQRWAGAEINLFFSLTGPQGARCK